MADPMPTILDILQTSQEIADRQLIKDAHTMIAGLSDYRASSVEGMLTDLASRLESRLDVAS